MRPVLRIQTVHILHTGENVLADVSLLRDALSLFQHLDDLPHAGSVQRVALRVHGDLSIQHTGESPHRRVERDHEHLSVFRMDARFFPCALDRFERAEGLVVVLAVHDVDLTVLFQECLHEFLALCLRIFSLHDSGEIPSVLFACFRERVRAADLRGGAHRPLNVNDMQDGRVDPPLLREPAQPLAGEFSLEREVGADPRGVEVFIRLHHPVDDDHRDPRFLRFLQNGLPPGLRDRRDHDVIHLLLDEIADGGDLLFLLLLRVAEHQAVSVVDGERLLHRRGIGLPPVGLRADLGESDRDEIVLRKGVLAVVIESSPAARKQGGDQHGGYGIRDLSSDYFLIFLQAHLISHRTHLISHRIRTSCFTGFTPRGKPDGDRRPFHISAVH